ncbi:linker histone H1 and H5 family protein [Opisthorchis viverrini]|uniref:Linker histone H1 and H5 family protein n=1 Tax=Opisthorchis viverrini TaxID=6198 RepID=A0A1S8WP33_OPIVI|nr:linker histone H1 and H5 family protein [Opisthorchis viverrini]
MSAAVAPAAPKAKKVVKKAPSAHPPYFDMVKHAIKELKERNGSSRQAIAKYVKAHYKVDDKADNHIRRALVSALKAGKLTHTKGIGASGSFKLAEKAPKTAAKPKAAKKPKTPKKAAAKKPKTPKPAAAKKPKATKPKAHKPKKAKTPKKAAKTIKPKKPVAKKTPKKVVKKAK